MVQFADRIGKPIQLLYYPPYPSTYAPVERCWGIRELHMLAWAQNMTWKGVHPDSPGGGSVIRDILSEKSP
jgi:DDE family transposase